MIIAFLDDYNIGAGVEVAFHFQPVQLDCYRSCVVGFPTGTACVGRIVTPPMSLPYVILSPRCTKASWIWRIRSFRGKTAAAASRSTTFSGCLVRLVLSRVLRVPWGMFPYVFFMLHSRSFCSLQILETSCNDSLSDPSHCPFAVIMCANPNAYLKDKPVVL